MTTRTWTHGDPEPTDHPPLVDREDVTWLWNDEDEVDIPSYQRLILTHCTALDGGPGAVLGSPCGLDWAEILEEYGPLREATAEEARTITERWLTEPSRVVS